MVTYFASTEMGQVDVFKRILEMSIRISTSDETDTMATKYSKPEMQPRCCSTGYNYVEYGLLKVDSKFP